MDLQHRSDAIHFLFQQAVISVVSDLESLFLFHGAGFWSDFLLKRTFACFLLGLGLLLWIDEGCKYQCSLSLFLSLFFLSLRHLLFDQCFLFFQQTVSLISEGLGLGSSLGLELVKLPIYWLLANVLYSSM